MAVFVFPCTGGEGSAMLGFLSHPLQLTQGRGQAQTHEELHIYVEGSTGTTKVLVSAFLPTYAIPFLSVEWEMWVSWHA